MEKNNIKKLGVKLFLAPFLIALGACYGSDKDYGEENCGWYEPGMAADVDEYFIGREDTNSYKEIKEKDFIKTSENDKSTFSLCSTTSAYTNIRNMVMSYNMMPDKNAIKIEQMLNYFKYSYQVNGDDDLLIFNEVSDCPWNSNHKLASIAVKAKEAKIEEGSCNFVFLIDVSGSMSEEIGLIKKSFNMLLRNVSDNDRISIVTYANGTDTVLDGASGNQKDLIKQKVDGLRASGGTYGQGGIQRAYEIASKHFIEGGNNRVILATDGDFNIGISNSNELEGFIASKRETGVYLTVLGYGMGNYHDNTAETLARNGNGNAFYIDNESTAERLFEQGISSTFEVVAKDTKTQVVFNANQVESYRLLGYENSMLTDEDFHNTEKDAGEVLSGDVTVAMYEIIPTLDVDLTDNLFTSEIHFKDPSTNEDKVVKNEVAIYSNSQSDDFVFQSLVVEYGLVLRSSEYKGNSSLDHIISRYENKAQTFNTDFDREEFYSLVKKTINIQNQNY